MSERRPYTKRKRADQEQQTRERIVEATVALHERHGPAATTISQIAEHAGVQRQTVYRHFPAEADLLAACSHRWSRQHPPPDPGPWLELADPLERLDRALRDLYAFYRTTESMTAHVLRDAPRLPALAKLIAPLHDYMEQVGQILLAPFDAAGARREQLASLLGLAMSFPAWQQLTRAQGLDDARAAQLFAELAAGLGR